MVDVACARLTFFFALVSWFIEDVCAQFVFITFWHQSPVVHLSDHFARVGPT